MFKNLEMDFIPFIPFIPKTGKKISHQQEQFVKNNHAITAVPSHLCQRISLAGPWRFDWFQGQTWTNWKAAVSYTKKICSLQRSPFAIKGYHFFKNPKSSKVDLGPHGLPRIAKPRNPWGLLSHNSLVQLQVCLRLSHGIPWYPQFHEIQKKSQLGGHLEGIYPYLSMYILFSDPYDYCNSTRCAGAGYFQRFLSPPKSVGGMWWIQQIYNDAKDDTFSLNADRNGQEHEQRTCLKIGVPMSPKSDGFSVYPLRLLGSIRAYCTYPFSKRHMLNRNHPAAICKHQRKHSGLFRERNLHKWSETQLGLLDRSTYLTYTPRQCAMKWGH